MKRIIKRVILLPLLCLLALPVILYYLMVYRFKDSIRFVINRETHGRYAFEAGRAGLSLWNKSIVLKQSAIRCVDTSGVDAYYEARIPEMYFSLASWSELLFNRKVVADSLSLTRPAFRLHTRRHKMHKAHGSFHAGNILTILDKTLVHFNVHSFLLEGGTFVFDRKDSPQPLTVKDIGLSIYNFTGVNNEDSHLLGSDKVVFTLGRQHWLLPGGKQEIGFRGLKFTSEGQRFEIDSFVYRQPPADGKGEMAIQAGRFLFTARHLPAIYQKEQLLIDTLICVNPVLTLPAAGHRKEQGHVAAIKADHPLFRLINVKYISVVNGELQLKGQQQQGQQVASRRTNLSIYNLDVDPARTPQVRTDSVRMNLQKITFVSKDSLWQLGIEEFSFNRDAVLFRNVSYGPTPANHQGKGIVFTAPALELRNVDVGALLAKRLVAADAQLYQPSVALHSKGPRKPGRTPAAPQAAATELFYQTLHGISQLIQVQHFHISNGNIHLHAAGKKTSELSINRLNAHILLHKLFMSDSLVDIKHAIPDFRVGEMRLSSGDMKITLGNYRFDGRNRRNWGRELLVALPGGATLEGRDIYWEVFDWDIYQKTRDIQVNYLRLGSLAVRAHSSSAHQKKTAQRKPLPPIRVYKLELDSIAVEQSSPAGSIQLAGKHVYADGISTAGHFFSWKKAAASLYNIRVKQRALEAGVKEVQFSNQGQSTFRDIDLALSNSNGQTNIRLPSLHLVMPVHSSDLASLHIPFLSAAGANLDIQQAGAKDTLRASLQATLEAKDIRPGNAAGRLLSFGAIKLAMRDAGVKKGRMHLQLPQGTLQLREGRIEKGPAKKTALAAALALDWQNASVQLDNGKGMLAADQLTGGIHIPAFSSSSLAAPRAWEQLPDKITLAGGRVGYRNNKINASVGHTRWDPATKTLALASLKVAPVASREETFRTSEWQGDYISVSGAALTLTGIRPGSKNDSTIHISRVTLDSMALDVSRDKSLPFRHGIEKPMPTRLLHSLGIPLQVDTVAFRNSSVAYHERKSASGQWSTMPLSDINGTLLNTGSRANRNDTLSIAASARLFNGHIQQLLYNESYADSLSGFRASLRLLPVNLAALSNMAMPGGPVAITSGNTDTIHSSWSGNKYAAYGNMHFFYRNLRVKVRNRKHPNRSGIVPALETWLANLILPNSKRKPSLIYFERDRERFIFNYWIKTQTRGVMSTMGIKSNRRYRKEYRRKQEEYFLGEEGDFGSRP